MRGRNSKIKEIATKLEEKKKELRDLLPIEIREEFYDNSFLGGGAIFSLYNDEEPKDYDFFLTNNQIVEKLRAHFNFNSTLKYKNGIKIGDHKGRLLIVTDNAISIGKFQIITRWVGRPEEVIGEFDFKHNMYYYHKGVVNTLVGWKYIEEKRLYYNEKRARDICGTILRVKKFVERGFSITNKEMSKMLLKLYEVGFNDRELEILKGNDGRNDFGS